jgi:serine/threonine protein phosphatase 1
LTLMHHAGDYVFVHAGIKPGVPLTEQDENDLLMIRDEFFNQSLTENKTVVHGHTVFPEPFIRARSIGIDTGAYASNILTAVALQDDHYEFITTDRGNL